MNDAYLNKVVQSDCLKFLPYIENQSIDMILCDLPYGITQNEWDNPIDPEKLWAQIKRIMKPNRAVALTSVQPFTTDLINGNRKWFKYHLIWDKKLAVSYMNAKHRPLPVHEEILIFGNGPVRYFPQMETRSLRTVRKKASSPSSNYSIIPNAYRAAYDQYYPKSILGISNADQTEKLHPTQKPVELFEYLVKTYTEAGEVVLDMTSGSGTTAIACLNTNRNYILIELLSKYVKPSLERIKKWKAGAERTKEQELW